jgi:hypothetical protein
MRSASVTVSVEIEDPTRLHQAATDDYLARAGTPEEAEDFLGTPEQPKLVECLRQLYDRELPPGSGIAVQDSYAEIGAGSTKPRTSTVLHLSTAHLTAEERNAISAALGIGPTTGKFGKDSYALLHAEHGGLYLKPKEFGFLVRMPPRDEVASMSLTPEMRRILELAQSFDAWQIDFDADEEPLETLPIFPDRQLIIRDFASGKDGEEPLYWSNTDGWVDRASADRFFLEQAQGLNLPLGGEPAFVYEDDAADVVYDPV